MDEKFAKKKNNSKIFSLIYIIAQVLTALKFYGGGSYQSDVGDNKYIGINQSSVSKCLHQVTDFLNHQDIVREWIKFPNNLNELNEVKQKYMLFFLQSYILLIFFCKFFVPRFWEKYHFPSTIGCIDCTHVAIFPPPVNHPEFPENIFVNRLVLQTP